MSVKNQIKSAKRAIAKATPKAPVKAVKVPKAKAITYHALIVADFKAAQNAGKAGVSEYQAFKAVLMAINLKDTAEIKAAQADIKATFGEAMTSSATIRCTMISNARKVEHGGTVDKQVIKGAGRQALVTAVDSVNSIRELRKAVATAKPSAMKDNRGGNTAKPVVKAKAKPAQGVKHLAEGLDVPESRPDAIQAAIKVLEFVATNYLTMTDNGDALTSTYATIKLLKAA
jgi:hypothetical protein